MKRTQILTLSKKSFVKEEYCDALLTVRPRLHEGLPGPPLKGPANSVPNGTSCSCGSSPDHSHGLNILCAPTTFKSFSKKKKSHGNRPTSRPSMKKPNFLKILPTFLISKTCSSLGPILNLSPGLSFESTLTPFTATTNPLHVNQKS